MRIRKFAGVIASAGVLTFAVNAGTASMAAGPETEFTAPKAEVDYGSTTAEDREIVGGLLFGIGDFAEETNNSVVIEDAELRQDYEEGATKSLDGFLESKGEDIADPLDDLKSGEVNRVNEGLDSVAQIYTEHVKDTVGEEAFAEAADEQGLSTAACGAAIACVAYAALAVHNTVAVTALAAAVVGGAVACGVWWVDCSANSAGVRAAEADAAAEEFVADVTRKAES